MTDSARELDLVVYGATGFVGKLLADYLAQHAPDGVRIALAGRTAAKLEAVRSSLGPRAADWPVIVANSDDAASLAALAGRTRVVATTVGPYAKYGHALASACAEAGTDYVDLTGEVLFARESIDANHDRARETGARIVHSCGFDSVPSDIGVHVLHGKVQADGAGELTDTTLVVTSVRGGVSGGTIDSLRTQVDVSKKDPALRRLAASPYSLSPDLAKEPDLGRQSDMNVVNGTDIAPDLKGWKAPFFMGPYNTRIVRRSNALRDWAYGRQFKYREVMNVGSSPLTPVVAGAVAAGLGAMVVGMAIPPTRYLLDRVLPSPGDGPSEDAQRKGHFTIDLYTTTSTGAHYTSRVKAKGDPGYSATAVMLGESALSLVLGGDALPDAAGVLTPATALGDVLVARLRDAGFEISARKL
ncbi:MULTISPECIES: trans-acting enoyl reductase family protein [unclassified Rhodococcus (in: high G+C Gram-positive bacteria)]|uniref:saccharopine dehydrogenase family protein n=1 Tax=unclassified Rhodococcus (in: high G+C Gram-positive bacteria) TaxID=192944 RepID=UPI0016398485|nr:MULTISPECIES: saccharopine dehydrogenase NADP-binding domain-containing protein [unclassified Rhodococcus (in: high G+C Gram-positive bacteria)]MBC2638359.1 saccharopine dehydrogenase NADP-binding domain-containing protein [Rhodococcus sp. 3A]MBC2896900.1 saccharopine dehydrogenase NADP-binding domain-containing protein [Rhodococcus sp. 4CII]